MRRIIFVIFMFLMLNILNAQSIEERLQGYWIPNNVEHYSFEIFDQNRLENIMRYTGYFLYFNENIVSVGMYSANSVADRLTFSRSETILSEPFTLTTRFIFRVRDNMIFYRDDFAGSQFFASSFHTFSLSADGVLTLSYAFINQGIFRNWVMNLGTMTELTELKFVRVQ